LASIARNFPAVVVLLIFVGSSSTLAQGKIPNDPYYKYQFSFHNPGGKIRINTRSHKPSMEEFDAEKGIDLNIEKAWAITTGSKSVVVALLDDGFCYDHPDLRDNIWHNPGEIGKDVNGFDKETNGVDDDHNGYVDDVLGWDFAFDSPDPDCHVFDGLDNSRILTYPHAMDALGIIGAKGNNGIGVAGINWDVSMMLLKIGAQGTPRGQVDLARVDRAARAIRYAADNGARIINWSGFVDDLRPERLAELREAVEYAATKNVLIVLGAGNGAANLDLDENCQYPACFDTANMIRVAQIDFTGKLYRVPPNTIFIGGSNYGTKRVEIAALGQNYATQIVNGVGTYALGGGTSCAAPVVSGVAALMLSVNPKLTAVQLRSLLMQSVTKLPTLKGKIASEGMVNAYQAVLAAQAATQAAK
jgi:subtilisin family serine protease